MNYLETEAIVLNGFKYGDTSKIVTLYTLLDGKFSVLIKGARNSKSNFGGVFENMNHIDIFYSKKISRNLQSVYKADNISSFASIKNSLDKISVAYRILDLTSKITPEFDQSAGLFNLLKNSLYELDFLNRNYSLLYLVFQIKLSGIIGIDPYFYRNFDEDIFVMDNEKQKHFNLVLNKEQVSWISNLLNSKDINSCNSDEEIVYNISDIYDNYIFSYTDKFGVSNNKKVLDELKRII
ncbi:MAG: DNA repair protein RecO [Ignavibacteria bacterium]|nr:DNA repair protein RecO [Ignavibacteria bacterium]